jgi:hypothetical protein
MPGTRRLAAGEAVTVQIPGLQVVARLGAGPAGQLWLCDQPALGRHVAVRRVPAGLAGDRRFRSRFVAEARLLARLVDIHTVAVYDLIEEADGGLALLMEYVPGASLRALLGAGEPLTVAQAVGVVADTLAGLAAAHRIGVLHRDLRPKHVLVDPAGIAKLGGFAIGPAGDAGGYLAPECRAGGPGDVRSDLYGAAMMLAETLGSCRAGRRPAPPPPPIAVVLTRALSTEPAGRYPSAPDFAGELHAATAACFGPHWQQQASLAGLVGALAAAGGAAGMAGMAGLAGGQAAAGGGWQAAAAQQAGANLGAAGQAGRAAGRAGHAGRVGGAGRQLRSAGRIARVVRHLPGGSAITGSPTIAAATVVAVAIGGAVAASTLTGGHPGRPPTAALGGWAIATAPAGAVNTDSLACPTANRCISFGQNAHGQTVELVSDDGGRTWRRVPFAYPTALVSGVSCTSSTVCVASDGLSTTNSGRTWTQNFAGSHYGVGPGPTGNAYTCPTATRCLAVGGDEVIGATLSLSDSGGSTSTPVKLPRDLGPGFIPGETTTQGAGFLTAIACADVQRCVAVGATRYPFHPIAFASSDGGTSWRQYPMPITASAVTCPTTTRCVAFGAGRLLLTTSAWTSWSWRTVQPVPGNPDSVDFSCPNARDCVAVGGRLGASGHPARGVVLVSTTGGDSWRVATPAGLHGYLSQVTCTSASHCVAVGGSSAGATYDTTPAVFVVGGIARLS